MQMEETYHRRHAPNIGAGAPFAPKDNFWRAVLPRLNVVGEVVTNPARVSKVCDLNGNDVDAGVVGRFIEGYARDFAFKDVTTLISTG